MEYSDSIARGEPDPDTAKLNRGTIDMGKSIVPRQSRYILGMRVDASTYRQATLNILQWATQGESRYVCEAPVAMVMEACDHPEYQALINGADLVTPGGMPIVWMMRCLGVTAQPRVYGPELTLHVCNAAAQASIPVGFYGGSPRALAQLRSRMTSRFPGLQVSYCWSPPFRPLTSEEDERITRDIRNSGCRILFIGLGCPKQERWMAEHRPALPLVMLGVGAAFDFLSGEKPQAFPWMQRLGLEWVFRLAVEPRRLWFRYLYHNPRFVVRAIAQLLRIRLNRGTERESPESRQSQCFQMNCLAVDTPALEQSLAEKRTQLGLKRAFDVLVAGAALVALAPGLLLIALLIRLGSPGPALFRQIRAGRGGKEFTMYKFRSMRIEVNPELAAAQKAAAAQGELLKTKRDPRVTPLGGILRSTSLDELPQLINVLRGEMSLVGPRPLVPFMLTPYPEFARARGLVRPGITGLWQVRERENNTSAIAMMAHDLEYLHHFQVGLDFAILARTVSVVLSRKGAV